MRNLKLKIEYDGVNYCGWQVQKRRSNKKSIQETIEKTLRNVLQEDVKLTVAGRTDAGVHARAQVANFRTASQITLKRLQLALNGNLPSDITVSSIEEKSLDFNSRFHAKSKVYIYTILNRSYPSALLRNNVYFCSYVLDVKLMRSESRCLIGKHDFKCFCASGSSVKNTIRTIKKLSVKENGPLITIEIEANGFLYNMIRSIVGTLVEIGRGRFKQGHLKKMLFSNNRKLVGMTVPACGLCLAKVKY